MSANPPCLVVYAWDGTGDPFALIDRDVSPDFDILVFDYSGKHPSSQEGGVPILSCATECKGEIFREVAAWLAANPHSYTYVGLIDDDISLAWSDLNTLIRIARSHRLDSFQAALSADSHASHHWTRVRRTVGPRMVPWVEVMMPFYRTELFMAGAPFYAHSISSYGLDQFVMPALQKLRLMDKVAVIDSVVVRHVRPITSDGKIFANGLSAHQERVVQWRMARALVSRERPDLVGTRWYLRTFAPLNGHHRFWPLRAAAPFHRVKRLLQPGTRA